MNVESKEKKQGRLCLKHEHWTNTLLMGRREESPIELTLSQSVSHYMAYVYDTVDL